MSQSTIKPFSVYTSNDTNSTFDTTCTGSSLIHVETQTEIILRKRLRKTLSVLERVKQKNSLEIEISKELAKRNEQLKMIVLTEQEKVQLCTDSMSSLISKFDFIMDQLTNDQVDDDTSTRILDFKDMLDSTLSVLTNSYTYGSDGNAINSNSSSCTLKVTKRNRSRSIAINEIEGTSLLRKSSDVNSPTSQTTSPMFTYLSSDNDIGETTTCNTAHTDTCTNTNNNRIVDDLNDVTYTNGSSNDSSGGSSMNMNTTSSSISNLNIHVQIDDTIFRSSSTCPSPVGCDGAELTKTTSSVKSIDPTLSSNAAPLFEHFIVAGALPEAASEFAMKLHISDTRNHQHSQSQTSSSIMRRLASSLFAHHTPTHPPLPGSHSHHNSSSISSSAPIIPQASDNIATANSPNPVATEQQQHDLSTESTPVRRSSLSRLAGSVMSKFSSVGSNEISLNHPDSIACEDSNTNNSNNNSSSNATTPVGKSGTISNHILSGEGPLAIVNPSILFRYPKTVEPPPMEVTDFCLPLGGRLQKLTHEENEDVHVQEILYGQQQSNRSSRCFIYMLEDKTSGYDTVPDDENGMNTGRLYGICVIHPRLSRGHYTIGNSNRSHASDDDAHTASSNAPDVSKDLVTGAIDFESSVCYCFITRYPFFDFFFHVIFDIISSERLCRMELIALNQKSITDYQTYARSIYEYLPTALLEDVLNRLTHVAAPRYGERICFQVNPDISINEKIRAIPPVNCAEHHATSADWALPILLSWLPPETLVWVLGMLMCEVKLIVIGVEPGMVSCAVMGLLSLLQPLNWVAPLIPILPLKNIDFVESPVPIIAGLVVDSRIIPTTYDQILMKCNIDCDTVTAVLDVSERELFISSDYRNELKALLMPGAELVVERIKHCLAHVTKSTLPSPAHTSSSGSSNNNSKLRPQYYTTNILKNEAKSVQEIIMTNITAILSIAKTRLPTVASPLDLELSDRYSNNVYYDDEHLSSSSSSSYHVNAHTAASPSFLTRFSTYGSSDYKTKSCHIRVSEQPLECHIDSFFARFEDSQMYHEYIDNLTAEEDGEDDELLS